jgi:hypothetical protein
MGKSGKKYREKAQLIDQSRKYTLTEAVELVKQSATARFDESVDVAVRLGVNPRHADQMFAVPAACHSALASRSALWSSLRAMLPEPLRKLVPTLSVQMSW